MFLKFYITVFLGIFSVISNASDLILYSEDQYFIQNNTLDILEDPESSYTLSDVRRKFSGAFKKHRSHFFSNSRPSTTYWIRLTVQNKADSNPIWLLEQYNYRINDLTLYEVYENGEIQTQNLGDNRPFQERFLLHKNLDFLLNLPKDEKVILYIRFKSELETPFQLVIRKWPFFTSYALTEYFLLGLFYGIILIFAIYNLFLFFSFHDRTYLWFVFYVTSFGVYFMTLDGTAYQYLWPTLPSMNLYGYSFFLFLTSVGFILYIKAFLNLPQKLPLINNLFNGYLGFRLLFYILTFFIPDLREITYLEIFPFVLAFIASWISFQNNYKPAKYLLLGHLILISAFCIHLLRIIGLIPSTVLTFYPLYLAPIMDVVMLSLALSERIAEIKKEKSITQKVQEELEEAVDEKTQALQLQNALIREKMANLDTFIYKVTHDLKGPIRSIMGLAQSAKIDKATDPAIYFDFIIKSTERLDTVISDLLAVSRTGRKSIEITKIDISSTITEIIESFQGNTDRKAMNISISGTISKDFYSEKTLVYSIIQNLIENGITYRNPASKNSFLKITLKEQEDYIQISFEDNGIGIGKEHLDKIFDMFYRADEKHHHKSTGLGLYMVKMALDRLESSITVESTENAGTTFTITLKNWKEKFYSFSNAENPVGLA